MNKFELETITVRRFFTNQDVDCENFVFIKKEEPCDVYCKTTDQQFQVTWNEHEFQKKIHTTPFVNGVKCIEMKNKIEKEIYDFLVDPVLKKVRKYQKSAEGIILLITAAKDFPFFSRHFEMGKKRILKEKVFFKEIYIVCPRKNIKIF